MGKWFNVHYQNELLSITLFSPALCNAVGSFTNRCQECKEQVWVQVFHIKGSRTTWKTCEVTLLCGSDNSSTYLPHVFNLPYAIYTCAISNGNRTEWNKQCLLLAEVNDRYSFHWLKHISAFSAIKLCWVLCDESNGLDYMSRGSFFIFVYAKLEKLDIRHFPSLSIIHHVFSKE